MRWGSLAAIALIGAAGAIGCDLGPLTLYDGGTPAASDPSQPSRADPPDAEAPPNVPPAADPDAPPDPPPDAADAGVAASNDPRPDAGAHPSADASAGPDAQPTPASSIVLAGVTSASYGSRQTTFSVPRPQSVAQGQLLVAMISLGGSSSGIVPMLTPPSGWTASGTTVVNEDSMFVYWHIAGQWEPSSYTWTSSDLALGLAVIMAYSGANVIDPIDGISSEPCLGASVCLASGSTSVPNALVFAVFSGRTTSAPFASWTPPTDMTDLIELNNGRTRSMIVVTAVQPAPGPTATFSASASPAVSEAIDSVFTLKPAD